MTESQLSPAELQLIKLKRENEALLIKEQEQKYLERLEYRDNWIEKQTLIQSKENENIKNLYYNLINEIDPDYFELIENENSSHYPYPYHLNEELKEEDKVKEFKLPKFTIKSKWGNFYRAGDDLSSELPSQLSNRYQTYKFNTIIKKIKEKIELEKQETNKNRNLDLVKENLIETFQDKYPGCQIEYKKEFRNPSPKPKYSFYIDTLKITFLNESWVKIKYYEDGSWGIENKFDSKKPTKEEIIDNLAN
jgi:hypothetical protein